MDGGPCLGDAPLQEELEARLGIHAWRQGHDGIDLLDFGGELLHIGGDYGGLDLAHVQVVSSVGSEAIFEIGSGKTWAES